MMLFIGNLGTTESLLALIFLAFLIAVIALAIAAAYYLYKKASQK